MLLTIGDEIGNKVMETYLKGRNFRGCLFSRINTDFLLISLFYADFDGISEKFAKSAKIRETREN